MKNTFFLKNGILVIRDETSQSIVWQGKPLNCSVESMIVDAVNERCFMLLSKGDGPRLYPGGSLKAFRNLICANATGGIIWTADLPGSGVDYYTKLMWARELPNDIFNVKLELDPNTLIALSVSGFLVNIDPGTGKFISKLLIK